MLESVWLRKESEIGKCITTGLFDKFANMECIGDGKPNSACAHAKPVEKRSPKLIR